MIGTRIGPYEVLAKLGEGGMGEVYRATDTKLKRQVAIKVLPASLGRDAERLARFQREAEVLASLNHPHIAAIYGLEDMSGVQALVMELVEGEDLAERLTRGPIPLDETLAIARQVADALEAAHEQGVIHRDLKPANIKVRPDGTVKVLDFGLAKLAAPGTDVHSAAPLSMSPTIASPVMTGAGVILGTAAYMSPEQARGKPVDARADIWAFGCVLYEMLTGRRPFDGEDVMSAIGAAIHTEPQWTALPASTPPALKSTIMRCLQKDPKQRARHIGDVRLAIDGAFGSAEPSAPAVAAPPRRGRRGGAAAAILASVIVTSVVTSVLMRPAAVERVAGRFDLAPVPGTAFLNFFALSPDGQRLAYMATDAAGATMLWIRSFESGESKALPRSAGIRSSIVWAPDGRSLAYATPDAFMRIGADGSAPQRIAPMAGWAGGDWGRDDTILFGSVGGALMKVAAGGGRPVPVTVLDRSRQETGHTNPSLLPDGNHFIYLRASSVDGQSGIFVGALDRKPEEQSTERLLATAEHALYARAADATSLGHLLYLRDSALVAQPFNESTRTLAGEPVQVADSVGIGPATYAHITVSHSGHLAYLPARRDDGGVPTWFDRSGRELGTLGTATVDGFYPRISPDGKRVALTISKDIWVYDIGGRPPIRITHFDQHETAGSPLWTPDGFALVFEAGGYVGLRLLPADGTSTTATSVTGRGHHHPHGWSSDGTEILTASQNLNALGSGRDFDILRVPLASPDKVIPVIASGAEEGLWGAELSPNKRYLAYVSNSTATNEVWVRPFPGPGAAERVSPSGGTEPQWSNNGRELIYLERDRFMSVKTTTDAAFTFSAPAPLFEVPIARTQQPPSYALAPDGRILVMKRPPAVSPPINIIVNWQDLPAVRAARTTTR